MILAILAPAEFLAAQIPGMAIGFVIGAFCPAVLRKIKAAVTKEATVLKTDVENKVTEIKKKL